MELMNQNINTQTFWNRYNQLGAVDSPAPQPEIIYDEMSLRNWIFLTITGIGFFVGIPAIIYGDIRKARRR